MRLICTLIMLFLPFVAQATDLFVVAGSFPERDLAMGEAERLRKKTGMMFEVKAADLEDRVTYRILVPIQPGEAHETSAVLVEAGVKAPWAYRARPDAFEPHRTEEESPYSAAFTAKELAEIDELLKEVDSSLLYVDTADESAAQYAVSRELRERTQTRVPGSDSKFNLATLREAAGEFPAPGDK